MSAIMGFNLTLLLAGNQKLEGDTKGHQNASEVRGSENNPLSISFAGLSVGSLNQVLEELM